MCVCVYVCVNIGLGRERERERERGWLYHKAQLAPLVQEVAVDVDAVGFGEVFGDELADGGEVGGFFYCAVGDIAEFVCGWWGGGGGIFAGAAHRGLDFRGGRLTGHRMGRLYMLLFRPIS